MSTEFSSFQGFKQTQSDLQEDLIQLENMCDELDMGDMSKSISETRDKITKDKFNVAVVGEFKRAKSTLINGLLGKEILPADPLPCSATLNRVTYDVTPHASIQFIDGTSKDIDVDELGDYVTKLTEESTEVASTIKEATVYYPLSYCRNNVDIIDTPGLNDDEAMTGVTLSVIPTVDLSIVAIMALSPFSQYEKDFLANKLMTSDVGKIVFAVTKIDLVDEDDRERVLAHIKKEIEKHILSKAKKVYEGDEAGYQEYAKKLGNIKVIGISPKQALKGKLNKDEELIAESNYPEFEKELERMLVDERGLIALNTQVSKILSASTEVLKVLSIYENSSKLSNEEFEQKYVEAQTAFEDIRKRRRAEEERIERSCENTVQKAKELLSSYWEESLSGAKAIVDQVEVTRDDLKKENIEATQKRVSDAVGEYLNNQQILLADKMNVLVEKEVGKEIEDIEIYGKEFSESVSVVHKNLITTGTGNAKDGDAIIAGTGGTVLTALLASNIFGAAAGGMYYGYKQAGLKGVVVGGVGSLGGAMAANFIGNVIFAATGLSILGWPILIGVGLAGAFAGKKAVEVFFRKSQDNVVKFKDAFKEQLSKSIAEQRDSREMEKSITKAIVEVFNGLSDEMHNETEKILKNTEKTLEDLKNQRLKNEAVAEQELEKRDRIAKSVVEISNRASELSKQLEKLEARLEA